MEGSPRIRVVVVDDSVVVRRLVSDVLQSDPGIEVVATSSNGRLGVDAVRRLKPDVVTMDIEMPVMDGIAAVREIRSTDRLTPIIMFSTLTERGARATFDALDAGATDYVAKPGQASAVGSGLDQVRAELLPRVRALAGRGRPPGVTGAAPRVLGGLRPVATSSRPTTPPRPAAGRQAPTARTVPVGVPRQAPRALTRRLQLVAVGSSTGGPEALSRVVGALPAAFPVPVVVVQHMPAEFTQLLAERLDRTCAVRVLHATDGAALEPGVVVVARGGRHLEVVRDGTVLRARVTDAPPENFCRPAVDVLFRSVARAVGGQSLGVVLTGMGADGTAGALDLAAAGAPLWAQDEASSVVWGMPGSLVGAGLADAVLPLGEIGPAVVAAVGRQGGPVAPPVRPALAGTRPAAGGASRG